MIFEDSRVQQYGVGFGSKLSNAFSAIDVKRSGTRREEMLLSKEELELVWNFDDLCLLWNQ